MSFELENIKKYGSKDKDIIATINKINPSLSVGFCIGSVHAYAVRYTSLSEEKSFNPKDLEKILDFANRALEIANKPDIYRLIEDIISNTESYKEEKKQSKKINTQFYFTQIVDSCIAIYCLLKP